MSFDYYFYLGKRSEDGQIETVGPYNRCGKLLPMEWLCDTTYDLMDYFRKMRDDEISDSIKKDLPAYGCDDNERFTSLYVCSFSVLPKDDYIKSAYYLIKDVDVYMKEGYKGYWDDLFYDYMTPEIYMAKAANEMKFGPPRYREDEFGNDVTPHSCGDYMYFTFPDYQSKEYLIYHFREIVEMFDEGGDYVIIMDVC